jgi:hypothetical protein
MGLLPYLTKLSSEKSSLMYNFCINEVAVNQCPIINIMHSTPIDGTAAGVEMASYWPYSFTSSQIFICTKVTIGPLTVSKEHK